MWLCYYVYVDEDMVFLTFTGERQMKTVTVSNTDRVLEILKAGEQLTAKQITARFKIANPHATISSLRMKGYAIYLNEHKNAKGEVSKKYRLGNPTREIVAAGIKALAAQGISI
jgi:predicted transcriptional regulator